MLLSDRDLKALVPQMDFETEEPGRAFDPEKQIQPCTIDLRLDSQFWEPRTPKVGRVIDFRNSPYGEADVSRLFRRRWLSGNEAITIRPGQMILARTYEKFTIPNGHAGKLEGRSTFARLGLSVHATGDFINPGWRGRMPLQLINHGKVPIVLMPYVPICQLLVTPTSSPSDRPYGDETTGHKYANDLGGPSKYWLDVHVQKLQEAYKQAKVPETIRDTFTKVLARRDLEATDRFMTFIRQLPESEVTSAREVLFKFATQDERRAKRRKSLLVVGRWAMLLPVSTALGAAVRPPPYEWGSYLIWIVAAACLIPGVWLLAYAPEPAAPFTTAEVEEYFDGGGT